ncbi:MAG: hypothetical protein ACKV2Q_22335 [Planctomycetaceae bacterium]
MNDKPTNEDDDELLDHYDIDFSKATPNRFAAAFRPGGCLVYLEPEVAARFPTSEDVIERSRRFSIRRSRQQVRQANRQRTEWITITDNEYESGGT